MGFTVASKIHQQTKHSSPLSNMILWIFPWILVWGYLLGVRNSKRGPQKFKPFRQGFAPPQSSELNREVWDQDQAGYWYPIQDEDTDELGNIKSSDQEEKQE